MLTDKEMLAIAKRFLKSLKQHFGGSDIEFVIITEETIKKTYGNIYDYQSKEYVLTGDLNKALSTSAPFLVEKKTGRVVSFGTATSLENYIRAYENRTLTPSLDRYWYPDEDRFDYK